MGCGSLAALHTILTNPGAVALTVSHCNKGIQSVLGPTASTDLNFSLLLSTKIMLAYGHDPAPPQKRIKEKERECGVQLGNKDN